MRVASNGNVGIGTSSPSAILSIVDASSNATFRLQNTSAARSSSIGFRDAAGNNKGYLEWANSSYGGPFGADNLSLHTLSTDPLIFGTDSAERVRITPIGRVGIGTSTPTELLEVAGKIKGTEICIGAVCRSTWPTGGGGTVTSIIAGTGLDGGTITGTGTISIAAGGVGTTELAAGSVTPAKLETVAGLSAGAYGSGSLIPTVTVDTKGRVTAISTTAITGLPTGTAGTFLKSGGGSSWSGANILMSDIKTSLGGTAFTTSACAANQALGWSSVADAFACQNIGSLDATKITTGTIDPLRLPSSITDGVWSAASGNVYRNSGNVGIGTNTPGFKLHVFTSSTQTTGGDAASAFSYMYANPGSSSAARFIGQYNGVESMYTGTNITGEMLGQVNYSIFNGTGTLAKTVGSWSGVNHKSAGTVTMAVGQQGGVSNDSTGVITNAMGLQSDVLKNGSGAITNAYGLYIGSIQATNAWSIFSNDAAAKSYLAGNLGIGTTTATRKFSVVGDGEFFGSAYLKSNNAGGNAVDSVQLKPYAWDNTTGQEYTGLSVKVLYNGGVTSAMDITSDIYTYFPIVSQSSWNYFYRDGNNTYPPMLYGIKNRGTYLAPTSILAGDGLFDVVGSGYYDTQNFHNSARISMIATENFTSTQAGSEMVFSTTPNGSISSLYRMTISPAGNVGIANRAPSSLLHVGSASTGTGVVARFQTSVGTCTMTPATSGTGIACSSDERLKRDIQSVSGEFALQHLIKLQAVDYVFKADSSGQRHTGFIAQKVKEVAPEFVRQDEDGTLQVFYDGFIPWITEAIKELYSLSLKSDQRVANLENENRILKNQNAAIMKRLEELEKSRSK